MVYGVMVTQQILVLLFKVRVLVDQLFINKTGEEVIPLKYDEVEDFSEGFAKVKLNGKVFYINKRGECVRDWKVI